MGVCHGEPPVTVMCGRYASYWNAFLFWNFQSHHIIKQESIPVGCVAQAWHRPYVLQYPLDVCTSGDGGPEMNKFKQVCSDGHQMSLTGVLKWTSLNSSLVMAISRWTGVGGSLYSKSHVRGGCTVRFNASWVVVTWLPPPRGQTDTHEWKHDLPVTLFDGW